MRLYHSISAEYEAVKTGCAWMERRDRAVLTATGEDRISWLQSLLSNDIRSLNTPCQAIPAFLLNPSGHIMADINVVLRSEDAILDIPRIVLDRTLKYLNRYIIEERVRISDQTCNLSVFTLLGAAMCETIASQCSGGDTCVVSSDGTGYGAYDIYVPVDRRQNCLQLLEKANIRHISEQTSEILRVEAGLPKYGVDMDESTLAPECDPSNRRISLTKGCYPGQEVVARIVSRGHVNRSLRSFLIDSSSIPAPRTKLYFREGDSMAEAGWITSVVYSPSMDSIIGMGYVRREYASEGAHLVSSGEETPVEATVARLPFIITNVQ